MYLKTLISFSLWWLVTATDWLTLCKDGMGQTEQVKWNGNCPIIVCYPTTQQAVSFIAIESRSGINSLVIYWYLYQITRSDSAARYIVVNTSKLVAAAAAAAAVVVAMAVVVLMVVLVLVVIIASTTTYW